MFKFICVALLCLVALTLKTHEPSHLIGKNINYDCCMQFGGVVCGTTFPVCCRGGCRKTWIGSTSCIGQKIRIHSDICPNSCRNMCRAQGGIICGTSVTTEDCCYPQFCQGTVSRSCVGGKIPLAYCAPGTSFSKWRW
jgi:hypothetical protein